MAILFTASATASVVNVMSGNDLQAALNVVQPGDTIVLQAGVTYTGNFLLRNHGGTEPVTIRTSALDSLPPSGSRVTPAHAQFMPKLVSPLPNSVLTANGAHNYKIIGVEFAPAPGVYSWALVDIGPLNATAVWQLSSNIEFDRVYVHGDPEVGGKRGITLNGRGITVRDSWISDMTSNINETQALLGWNGPGPFTIVNNYLEASGENIMFGGAVATIPNLVPCDIEIRGNHVFKPLSWKVSDPSFAGKKWIVKNLFELKNACRVKVEGNLFENNWPQSQTGYAILFTPRSEYGKMPWAVVNDVTFTRNIVRNAPGGFTIMGRDGYGGTLSRVKVSNNFLDNLGEMRLFGIYTGAQSVTIEHNTSLAQKSSVIFAEQLTMGNFVLRDNMFNQGTYGIVGTNTPPGAGTLATYFPGAQVLRNVFIGGTASWYPAGNFFPRSIAEVGFADLTTPDYSLSASSAYKNAGTDGKDIGADISDLRLMELAVRSGSGAGIPSREPGTGSLVAGISIYPTTMYGGASAIATITLAEPAASGGVNIPLSSSSTNAWVPTFVTVPGGARTATVAVQTSGVSTSTLATISAGSPATAKSAVITMNPPVLSQIIMYPATMVGGTKPVSQHRVILSSPAPLGGTVVTLSDNHAALWMPPTVTVPAGSTNGYFLISTTAVAGTTPVTVTASLGGVTRNAAITITAARLHAVTIYPGAFVGGTKPAVANKVYLEGPAPAPTVVSLVSSNPAVAAVPATVTIPAGASTILFPISSPAVTADTAVTITATYGGITRTAAVKVLAPTIAMFSIYPYDVKGGTVYASNNRVTLSGPAPAGGAIIKLASSNAAVVVPPSITIPQGQSTALVPVTAAAVKAITTVTVTATYGTITRSFAMTIRP